MKNRLEVCLSIDDGAKWTAEEVERLWHALLFLQWIASVLEDRRIGDVVAAACAELNPVVLSSAYLEVDD